jgi:hypothetical protein
MAQKKSQKALNQEARTLLYKNQNVRASIEKTKAIVIPEKWPTIAKTMKAQRDKAIAEAEAGIAKREAKLKKLIEQGANPFE